MKTVTDEAGESAGKAWAPRRQLQVLRPQATKAERLGSAEPRRRAQRSGCGRTPRPGPAAAAAAAAADSRLSGSPLTSAAVPARYPPLRRRVGVQHPGALHPRPHRVHAAAQRLFLHAASTPLDAFLNPKHENNLFLWKISSPLKKIKKKKKKERKERKRKETKTPTRDFFFFSDDELALRRSRRAGKQIFKKCKPLLKTER
ncbi:uncharacterized protein LOC134739616 [Pongo pygmaeus]|uniref:uncharacterized protein LOC134739616 n=1 Tax=Pongo pygmaeus TaxID=9600 RepID=UPI00300D1CCD